MLVYNNLAGLPSQAKQVFSYSFSSRV